MPVTTILRWHDGEFHPLDHCDLTDTRIVVADSWLVSDGLTLGIDLHRERFLRSTGSLRDEANDFWDAAIQAIPRDGDWFPRVEAHVVTTALRAPEAAPLFVLRLRSAPERSRSVRVSTHLGPDPRTQPLIKGPDTEALLRARTAAQQRGAEEAVIVSEAGEVVEGAYSALLWWRGDALCSPAPELARVDSVTARSVITLATALGIDVLYESVRPDQLDGLELWSLSALHGIRIVTAWVGEGPAMAELPGRLAAWRSRLEKLRRPIGETRQQLNPAR